MRKFCYVLTGAILMGVVPVAFGHSYGPPPRVTAGPGDSPRACTLCHGGNAPNAGTGSVKVILQSAAVYIPGVKQRITVEVADPNQRRWGFELSARLNSDPEKGQAGDFTSIDHMTQVICEDNAPKPCASGVSFVTHTTAGSRNGTRNGAAFQFDWTPPSTDVGKVTFYVAGNAANGDGTNNGDLIYTSSLELTPAIPTAPTVTAGNVVSAATSLAGPVSPNSWVTVYGSNLAVTTRSWTDADFVNGAIPASLDGVSVLVNLFGAPRIAYVGYVSPTQVNFVLPSDLAATAVTVQVRNPAGISSPVPLTVQANAAQLFTGAGNAILATHANGSLLGKTSPAAPGETISIYATGCGPTTPALTPGQVPVAPAAIATLPRITIGGEAANVLAGGIIPNTAGLYQINVQVPASAANGDLPLVMQVGTASTAPVLISVQK